MKVQLYSVLNSGEMYAELDGNWVDVGDYDSLAAELEKYKDLCAAMYYAMEVIGAPESMLNVLHDSARGQIVESPISALLPVTKEDFGLGVHPEAILEGWALVPRLLTQAMADALFNPKGKSAWSAMLAAAPEVPKDGRTITVWDAEATSVSTEDVVWKITTPQQNVARFTQNAEEVMYFAKQGHRINKYVAQDCGMRPAITTLEVPATLDPAAVQDIIRAFQAADVDHIRGRLTPFSQLNAASNTRLNYGEVNEKEEGARKATISELMQCNRISVEYEVTEESPDNYAYCWIAKSHNMKGETIVQAVAFTPNDAVYRVLSLLRKVDD
jgi:hypothetical protein